MSSVLTGPTSPDSSKTLMTINCLAASDSDLGESQTIENRSLFYGRSTCDSSQPRGKPIPFLKKIFTTCRCCNNFCEVLQMRAHSHTYVHTIPPPRHTHTHIHTHTHTHAHKHTHTFFSTFLFITFFTTVLSQWDFSHRKFGLPSMGKASCERVALPNLRCIMLGVLAFP